jgi:hypothetical protein
MSAASPEPSLGNTGLERLWILLGEVACKWKGVIKDGDVNNTECPQKFDYFEEHREHSDANSLLVAAP